MAAAWNPPTPIDKLFEQRNHGIYIAAAGQEPLVVSHVARLGYNIILQTGLFADACVSSLHQSVPSPPFKPTSAAWIWTIKRQQQLLDQQDSMG
jgi:hypothetical protein